MTLTNKVSGGLTGAAGSPISPLTVEVTQETNDRLHIKIYDPNNQRWEVPTRYINLIGSSSWYCSVGCVIGKISRPYMPYMFPHMHTHVTPLYNGKYCMYAPAPAARVNLLQCVTCIMKLISVINFDIPCSLLPVPQPPSKPPSAPQYSFILPKQGEQFSFAVVRYANSIAIDLVLLCLCKQYAHAERVTINRFLTLVVLAIVSLYVYIIP